MIRLGGPVAGLLTRTQDPEELARAHRGAGYTAAYCPLDANPGLPPGRSFGGQEIAAARKAFARADVVIAEVGAWCNLQDPTQAEVSLAYVCERLDLADALGARCCVDYIGSLAPGTQFAHHPDNLGPEGFDRCVETVRKIIDAVRPSRAKFCLETMQTLVPDSPEVYLDLVKAIDRPAFAVHMDPANLVVSPRIYSDIPGLLRRAFALLGPHIVSCHAKDLMLREALALHIDEAPVGQGAMDYTVYLECMHQLGADLPLMLEHLETAGQYAAAKKHIEDTAARAGIPLYGAG